MEGPSLCTGDPTYELGWVGTSRFGGLCKSCSRVRIRSNNSFLEGPSCSLVDFRAIVSSSHSISRDLQLVQGASRLQRSFLDRQNRHEIGRWREVRMRAVSLGMMAMESPSEMFESEHRKGRVDGSLADTTEAAQTPRPTTAFMAA
jgi:hypothetical protein